MSEIKRFQGVTLQNKESSMKPKGLNQKINKIFELIGSLDVPEPAESDLGQMNRSSFSVRTVSYYTRYMIGSGKRPSVFDPQHGRLNCLQVDGDTVILPLGEEECYFLNFWVGFDVFTSACEHLLHLGKKIKRRCSAHPGKSGRQWKGINKKLDNMKNLFHILSSYYWSTGYKNEYQAANQILKRVWGNS